MHVTSTTMRLPSGGRGQLDRDPGDAVGPPALVETHTSVVVFLGDRAYKVKKAVDLGFLDFSTREARLAACQAEIELNRRLAPDVYLGVADVTGPDGQLCDHMVVMRRMPENRRLSTMVASGDDVSEALRALARQLAAFHSRCETSPEIAEAGSPATIRGLWDEGLAGLAPFRGTVLDAHSVDEIGRLARQYLAGREPLLARRQHDGRVRDGHGDLLAGDIFCLDDGPRVLDCLEFDRRLRIGDVLADVAFLAMDLQRLGAPELATTFLAWYGEFSAETHPVSLAELYIAYRAFVRCKVACLRHAQGDREAANEARALAHLTLEHLRRGRVHLVLVGGLPASGKSTLASRLVDDTDGSVLLRSDVVRKELAGIPADQSAAAPVGAGIYTRAHTEATYDLLLTRARSALEHGETVVLDASWSSAADRARAARLAEETSADLIELRCEVSAEVAATRIARRRCTGGDASDATADVLTAMTAGADPWPGAIMIHTAVPLTESLRAARSALLR
ncbi:AAA family ATPase [Frankia sp. Cas3]|uniref:bifunctional aminoglycoside phosphotransferase/ATP-binding protein n=1 Tax=Frankia sp. Cas3 TaxID=3073926 RepID=UPI002AD48F68|nr:AAA family ATPase [Frankia sp. Cas3]